MKNKTDIQKLAKKDKFYITAIDNLLKKTEYLQLTIQFKEELISEDEYNDELEKNEDKYLIKMNLNCTESDFSIMYAIINKLNRRFTGNEISELFSIPMDKANVLLKLYNERIPE